MGDIPKVTDPNKIVTDTLVLNQLAKVGIDKDYVEFTKDYDKASPYAKVYTDLKSTTKIAAISGLPGARVTDGTLLIPAFEQLSSGKFNVKNNLFEGYVTDSGELHISCLNDQPDGRLAGEELHSIPTLYVNNAVVPCTGYTHYSIDPTNPNMTDNVIDFNYSDVCTHRIRIVQGRIKGQWIFTKAVKWDCYIQYTTSGKMPLVLGHGYDSSVSCNLFPVDLSTPNIEFISKSSWSKAVFPVMIGDSPATFNPDAHTETSTCDGYCGQYSTNVTWATLKAAAGSYGDAAGTYLHTGGFLCGTTTDRYDRIWRGGATFNTAVTLSGMIVDSATVSIYGQNKYDQTSPTKNTPATNIYSFAPASNTDIAAGDYDSLGTTAYCDTAIAYADYTKTGFNDWAFNATGLAAIPTDGTTITKIGWRNTQYDVGASTPTWGSAKNAYTQGYPAEQGVGYIPKLVVAYHSAATLAIPVLMNIYRQRR